MSEAIVILSEKAIAHIQQTIARRGSGIGFRLDVKQTGCSGYMYVPEIIDSENPDDIKVSVHKGFALYVSPHCVDIIKGTYIDYVAKKFGIEQLEYDNPNADSLCGCGESFNLKDQHE